MAWFALGDSPNLEEFRKRGRSLHVEGCRPKTQLQSARYRAD